MTSNEPHPLATISTPFLKITKHPWRGSGDLNPMALYGRIIALRFIPGPYLPAFTPFIILFDWIAGLELGRVELKPYAGCSISFISEEYFVVAQGYKPKLSSAKHKYQEGNLLVFHIPSSGKENQRNELLLCLCGEASPIPNTAFWSTRAKPVPKVYELSRWNHLCLYYEASNGRNPPRASGQRQWCFGKTLGASGLLYVSSQALLTLVIRCVDNEPALIPWETWGNYAASLPVIDLPSAYMWGRKYAFLRYSANDSQLIILDFIPRGLPAQQSIEGENAAFMPPESMHDAYNPKSAPSLQLAVGKFLEPEAGKLDMRYRRTVISLENGKHHNLYVNGLQIDDEHLVTAVEPPMDVTGSRFFWVYTI
ncbi:hypothetical protein RSOLAG22IIIB_04386 [Rhizoctonia solani]|uniref:Uncharacterized protein n=1 Tax=Rhizoctonia solani TaxID=456999 RepID=A0A0K6FXS8_9AGAM|nr:hypothetical protein RSOLAG22IIIB_04386 [Rhizoctonia solani]